MLSKYIRLLTVAWILVLGREVVAAEKLVKFREIHTVMVEPKLTATEPARNRGLTENAIRNKVAAMLRSHGIRVVDNMGEADAALVASVVEMDGKVNNQVNGVIFTSFAHLDRHLRITVGDTSVEDDVCVWISPHRVRTGPPNTSTVDDCMDNLVEDLQEVGRLLEN